MKVNGNCAIVSLKQYFIGLIRYTNESNCIFEMAQIGFPDHVIFLAF